MNILLGPKLGDLIHCLLIPKMIFETKKIKSNIFICENYIHPSSFTSGIKKTYEETYNLITEQEYVESYKIFNNEKFDLFLGNFRISKKIYKDCWTNMLLDHFLNNEKPIFNIEVIKTKKDESLKDKILINRKNYRINSNKNYFYKNLFKKFKDDVLYLEPECNKAEDQFTFNQLNSIKTKNLYDFIVCINSCKLFIGNLSAPLAIATCLNKDRIGELTYPDAHHYINDFYNYDTFSWFDDKNMMISNKHKNILENLFKENYEQDL